METNFANSHANGWHPCHSSAIRTYWHQLVNQSVVAESVVYVKRASIGPWKLFLVLQLLRVQKRYGGFPECKSSSSVTLFCSSVLLTLVGMSSFCHKKLHVLRGCERPTQYGGEERCFCRRYKCILPDSADYLAVSLHEKLQATKLRQDEEHFFASIGFPRVSWGCCRNYLKLPTLLALIG